MPFLSSFPHSIIIDNIIQEYPDNCCGSVSASIVFTKFGLTWDKEFFISKGRDGNATEHYPISGSNILGTALAMASTNLVHVDIFSEFSIEKYGSEMEDYEWEIFNELKKLQNYSINPALSIDEVLSKISENYIPILAFQRDGKPEMGHFSPLRGLSGLNLILPLNDSEGSCNCKKEVFEEIWWTKESLKACLFLRKLD